MSDNEYRNFTLDFEYKLAPGSNSGVFLRAWPEGKVNGADFHEVQLLDETSPKYASIRPTNRTGSLFAKLPALPGAGPRSRPLAPHDDHRAKRSGPCTIERSRYCRGSAPAR